MMASVHTKYKLSGYKVAEILRFNESKFRLARSGAAQKVQSFDGEIHKRYRVKLSRASPRNNENAARSGPEDSAHRL